MSFEIEPIKYTDNMKILVDKVNDTIRTITDGIAVAKEQNFTATDNQKEFTLSSAYRVGSRLLEVYVEGIRQRLGIDYEEIDNLTVTFMEGLLKGDKVFFKWFSPYGDVLLGTVNINDPTLLPDGSIPESKIEVKLLAPKEYVDSNLAKLDTKVTSQASGSPKGVYGTIEDLQSAFPTGNTNTYVVTEDGDWYYWSGNEWISGGVYQGIKLSEKSVTEEHVSFVAKGRNKWDGKYTKGARLIGAGPASFGEVSGAMCVIFKGNPGYTYTISRSNMSNGYFGIATFNGYPKIGDLVTRAIQGNASITNPPPTTLTLQSNEHYIVISISEDGSTPERFQVEEGTLFTEYASPDNLIIKLEQDSIPFEAINKEGLIISPEHTSFVDRGKNLWDGEFIRDLRLRGVSPYSVTKEVGSISVIFKGEVGKTYTISRSSDSDYFGVSMFAQYPIEGSVGSRGIRGNGPSSSVDPVTVTLQGDEQYIFIGVSSSTASTTPTKFQIEEGKLATGYSRPGSVVIKFDQESIPSSALKLEQESIPFSALNKDSISIEPEHTSFIRRGKNQWDGEFVYGLRMSGPAPHSLVDSVGSISLSFKGVKGKTYTISKPIGTDWDGVFVLNTQPKLGSIGTRGLKGNGGSFSTFTVTLQGDEQWIFVSLSSPTQGIKPKWLQIEEGSVATEYSPPNSVYIENLDTGKTSLSVGSPKIHINKTGNTMDIYVPSKTESSRVIRHQMIRQINPSSSIDTWLYHSSGIYTSHNGAYTLQTSISPGNSDNEGVLYVKGESDFIGGKHGFDIMESIDLIVDGMSVDVNTDFDVECSFIKIVNKSRVNHDLSEDLPENKAFTRYKIHTWDLDSMTLEGKWVAEHQMDLTSIKLCDYSIEQKSGETVLSSWGRNDYDYTRYDLSESFSTTPRVKNVNTQEVWSSQTNFYLALTCVYDRSKYPEHYTHVQQLNGSRAKIYFDFGPYTIQAGESIDYTNKYDFRF